MILHSPSKQNKGFVALLLVGIVAVAALGLAGYEWYSNHNQKLGAVVTDTQLTDTLGTFRTNTNTNIDNINAELNGVSTTIGTYGNLVTLNSPLASIYGGTGLSAAPSANQFLSASGTMPAWKTITWGSGLNSTTTATSVQISTQGIDTTANYNWTGLHTFTSLTSASTTLNGTTTVTGASVFSSAPKINTTSTNPSSTATYGQLTSLVPTFYQTSTITNSYNQPGGQYSATTTITVPAAVVSTLNTWLCTGSAATSAGTGALYVGATQLFSFSIPTTGFASTLTWYSTSTGALAYRTYYASSGSNQSGGFNCTPTSIYFYQ
jgi:hypothetical protein